MSNPNTVEVLKDGQLAVATTTVNGTIISGRGDQTVCALVQTDEGDQLALKVLPLDGGSGGGITEDKIIIKSATIPAASSANAGYMYCYNGETNATYTHGYVYENKKEATYDSTVSFNAATISGTTVTCDGDDFAAFASEAVGADPTAITSGTMTYDSASNLWVFVGKDANNQTVATYQVYQEDYEDAGFTFTGTPSDGDVVSFTCTIEESTASYSWVRVDVQPAGGSVDTSVYKPAGSVAFASLPTLSASVLGNVYNVTDAFTTTSDFLEGEGKAYPAGTNVAVVEPSTGTYKFDALSGMVPTMTGATSGAAGTSGLVPAPAAGDQSKYLTGAGTWVTPPAAGLTNTATGGNSLTIIGSAATSTYATNVGSNSSAAQHATSVGYSASATTESVAIGAEAAATKTGCVAVGGYSTYARNTDSIAIGRNAYTDGMAYNTNQICIGYNAHTQGSYNIQLGPGTNPYSNTFCVGLDDSHNYLLLNSTGKIPSGRLPEGTPTTAIMTSYTGVTGSTLTSTASGTIERIYKNGTLLTVSTDYTVSSTTITFTTALVSTDVILVETAGGITKLIKITQSAYTALETASSLDANAFYLVVADPV